MNSINVVVTNQIGLHARPASKLARKASEYASDVWVQREGEEEKFNAKSITAILRLGAVMGTRITVSADGPDQDEACKALCQLIRSGLEE